MKNIMEGFVKTAKINYMDLYGLRSKATNVVKDLKPMKGSGVNVTTKASQLSASANQKAKSMTPRRDWQKALSEPVGQ
jgi:hypothetical protein